MVAIAWARVPVKFCPRCVDILDDIDFSTNPAKWDGLDNWCLDCRNADKRDRYWRRKNEAARQRALRNERQRRWRAKRKQLLVAA